MSDYGLQVYTEAGLTRLSITDRTFRLVDVFLVPSNAPSSKTISGIGSKSPIACAAVYNPSGGLYINFAYRVFISGDTVFWDGVGLPVAPSQSIIWVYISS